MNKSLISIIMPVYNTGKYLERCLNSIINQTYTNLELIAVNDGSTDNSPVILKKYAQKDNRIIILEQENQGQSVARNKALDIVKGEYICFVDSDDWVELDYLERLYEAITKTNSEIAICSFYYSTDKGQKIGYKFSSNIIPLKEYKSKLIKDIIYSFLVNYIFKRELFDDIRFKEGVFFEDYIIFNKLLEKLYVDVNVVSEPLYHYYIREESSVHKRDIKVEKDFFEALKSRYELNYINNEEKAYCLMGMLNAFAQISKIYNRKSDLINNYLKTINSSDKLIFTKAKKLLNKMEFFRFNMAYYFPDILYKIIFNTYSALKHQKDALNFCHTKVI